MENQLTKRPRFPFTMLRARQLKKKREGILEKERVIALSFSRSFQLFMPITMFCFIALSLFSVLYPPSPNKRQLKQKQEIYIYKRTVVFPSWVSSAALMHVYISEYTLPHLQLSMSYQELWGNCSIAYNILYPRSKIIWVNSAWKWKSSHFISLQSRQHHF